MARGAHNLDRVSIHAPREGCDRGGVFGASILKGFNSRTPGGVRHELSVHLVSVDLVSIHAPREGCDASQSVVSIP